MGIRKSEQASEATKRRAIDAYVSSGVTQRDIAKAVGVSSSTIEKWLREAGVPKNRSK
jgi:transposase-like protein